MVYRTKKKILIQLFSIVLPSIHGLQYRICKAWRGSSRVPPLPLHSCGHRREVTTRWDQNEDHAPASQLRHLRFRCCAVRFLLSDKNKNNLIHFLTVEMQ